MRRNLIALAASALVLTLGPGTAVAQNNQSANESAGTAQVGSADVDAPVRVLSDGDNTSTSSGSGPNNQSANESAGTAQVGSDRNPGGGPSVGSDRNSDGGPGVGSETARSGAQPAASGPLTLASAGRHQADLIATGNSVQTGDAGRAGSLPVTGFEAPWMALLGAIALLLGFVVRERTELG
jgi:LPXTG-motif cell wall-anchored protein